MSDIQKMSKAIQAAATSFNHAMQGFVRFSKMYDRYIEPEASQVGDPDKIIEIIPLEEPVPAKEPTVNPTKEPRKRPEKVPA